MSLATPLLPYFLIMKLMKFLEISFFEDCDLEDTFLLNEPIKFLKKFLLYHKIGLIKLPPNGKPKL